LTISQVDLLPALLCLLPNCVSFSSLMKGNVEEVISCSFPPSTLPRKKEIKVNSVPDP
jgi:hypothetical protein